ncbi:SUPPRESSOR OF GAMMA RESPONSE 1 isoform X1 [Morus notabilis]|uniref:SUPPRESSOR OF GAMMA RESPONSE 1 isoform X1 n=1 Tax=Morus notabilis TaxID=981085 RepID=UPI000CED70CA|nr:SUPPRESSOR OF GAMMA RESPONSE 1 isoform X1 [Morus notabilis]
MAGPSWLVDSKRIATKIKSASGTYEHERVKWKSNPTRACPNCQYVIDNSDVAQEWPGLPGGVKFDPTDQEIIWHLLAKNGEENLKPHPFINEFIPTVDEDDGICYVHPRKLPGVKQDGSVSHFFHRAIKAYNTGTRKRRKIHDEESDVRWHKTGHTKPVILAGVQRGCKKFMVLYMTVVKGGKAQKTNWAMHQYHLGTEEDEKHGEFVISKIFYQQNRVKQGDKNDQDIAERMDDTVTKVYPLTPKSVMPDTPRGERRHSEVDLGEDTIGTCIDAYAQKFADIEGLEDDILPEAENENQLDQAPNNNENNVNCNQEDPKWWDSESQNLLDSQQLVDGLSLCDDLLQSQSPNRDGIAHENGQPLKSKPKLADYAQLGPEDLKKDLEECQNLVLDPANIELDTPPDFRLSQLEFGSQESFVAWGGKLGD